MAASRVAWVAVAAFLLFGSIGCGNTATPAKSSAGSQPGAAVVTADEKRVITEYIEMRDKVKPAAVAWDAYNIDQGPPVGKVKIVRVQYKTEKQPATMFTVGDAIGAPAKGPFSIDELLTVQDGRLLMASLALGPNLNPDGDRWKDKFVDEQKAKDWMKANTK